MFTACFMRCMPLLPVIYFGHMIDSELREKLAEIEHERWSDWVRHMFTKGVRNSDGSFTIDVDSVAQWERQMDTDYADLPESEKRGDRQQVSRYQDLLG